jgi:hypothetical protein
MNIKPPLKANGKSPVTIQPRQRTLYKPAVPHSGPTAFGFDMLGRQQWFNELPQHIRNYP